MTCHGSDLQQVFAGQSRRRRLLLLRRLRPRRPSRNGGPVAVGAQAFAHPFVFPGGRQCRSFDELALACQEEWTAARDLLKQGYLENFFGGLGRVDLAMAAKEAAKFPDRDRGLDQLLDKLPTDVLASRASASRRRRSTSAF